MDKKHKAMRDRLSAMAPYKAVEYIKSFELPVDEETVLVECDVRRKSCVQVAETLRVSTDTVKRYKRRAYNKITTDF